jgi:hypothetical protein
MKRAQGRWATLRRGLTLLVVLTLLGLLVPNAGRAPTEVSLVKVEGASGLDTEPGVVWILALGSDARPGEPVLRSRSDAIQLVGMNPRTGDATVIGIPRDSYVAIPGFGQDKINSAMVYGGPQLAGARRRADGGHHPRLRLHDELRRLPAHGVPDRRRPGPAPGTRTPSRWFGSVAASTRWTVCSRSSSCASATPCPTATSTARATRAGSSSTACAPCRR